MLIVYHPSPCQPMHGHPGMLKASPCACVSRATWPLLPARPGPPKPPAWAALGLVAGPPHPPLPRAFTPHHPLVLRGFLAHTPHPYTPIPSPCPAPQTRSALGMASGPPSQHKHTLLPTPILHPRRGLRWEPHLGRENNAANDDDANLAPGRPWPTPSPCKAHSNTPTPCPNPCPNRRGPCWAWHLGPSAPPCSAA